MEDLIEKLRYSCFRTEHHNVGRRTKKQRSYYVFYMVSRTTFEKENLVTDTMGYFFHHKKAPKTKFAAKF